MESQPQNPEFRNNPENFHPCVCQIVNIFLSISLLSLNFPSHHGEIVSAQN